MAQFRFKFHQSYGLEGCNFVVYASNGALNHVIVTIDLNMTV